MLLDAYLEHEGDWNEIAEDERVRGRDDGVEAQRAIVWEAQQEWSAAVHLACAEGCLKTLKRLWHDWAVDMNKALQVKVSVLLVRPGTFFVHADQGVRVRRHSSRQNVPLMRYEGSTHSSGDSN